MDTSESEKETPRREKSRRSRAPSPERWREELETGEKGENLVITERYIDSDMAESDVANDGSGAEDNERVRVILTDNPRQGRTLEDRPGQALMEFDEPVNCLVCKMLLNGRSQYEDHLRGKRHKKKKRAQRRGHRALSISNDDDDDQAPTERNNNKSNGIKSKQDRKRSRKEEHEELEDGSDF